MLESIVDPAAVFTSAKSKVLIYNAMIFKTEFCWNGLVSDYFNFFKSCIKETYPLLHSVFN